MYVITANSGFFESIRGSSRIIKGVLSEQDIISAPLAPQGTRSMLSRFVGGAGMTSSLANVLSKAGELYEKSKPLGQVIKGMLPSGTARDLAGMAGYGTGGTGAGTGGTGAGRRGLSQRLM